MASIEFFDDPGAFLARVGSHLAADPVVSTVLSTVAERACIDDADGVARDLDAPRWWVVLTDEHGGVVGTAMRTASSAPYPLYVLPMPEASARLLARTLHERGDQVTAINGATSAAWALAEESGLVSGCRVELVSTARLFELGDLRAPEPPPGRFRRARLSDAEVITEWFALFMADADEQSGRDPGTSPDLATISLEETQRRIAGDRVWVWAGDDDEPVHVTACSSPSFGVARIGPVFTPRSERGKGYAAAGVAGVSQWLRDRGARVCLFTDQANPVSNALYERLGYQRVVDMVNLTLLER